MRRDSKAVAAWGVKSAADAILEPLKREEKRRGWYGLHGIPDVAFSNLPKRVRVAFRRLVVAKHQVRAAERSIERAGFSPGLDGARVPGTVGPSNARGIKARDARQALRRRLITEIERLRQDTLAIVLSPKAGELDELLSVYFARLRKLAEQIPPLP